ncbi:MAG: hypothetical protein ACJ76H_15185 [Bacteriovoracaceae bacterium]
MRALILITFLFPLISFAGLERLSMTNLNFDYTCPQGSGSADKIDVGVSKMSSEDVSVEKIDDTFVARTGVVSFQWVDPWKELLNIEKLNLTGVTFSASKLVHDISVPQGSVTYKGEYKVVNGTLHCEGTSALPDLEDRILEDCRDSMKVEMDRFDVPTDFFLFDLLSRIPQVEDERPLKNFTLTVKEGDFYLYFLANYVVKAGLRAWGNVSYEDDLKTMVIRVDLVKFGVIPITSLVMKELKNRIKSPDITVDPPFVRIRMSE